MFTKEAAVDGDARAIGIRVSSGRIARNATLDVDLVGPYLTLSP